jgi:hypothetical protein
MKLAAAELRAIAVEASCDPRTVARVLRGERASGLVDARIRRVLVLRGIVLPKLAPEGGDPLAISYAGRLRA